MQLKGRKQIYDAKRAISRTIRLGNHAIENPDHYGSEHAAELARRTAFWLGLDPEQRAQAIALLKAERDAIIAAHPGGVEYSGVADLNDEAIATAVAYLDSLGGLLPPSSTQEG